MKQHTAYTDIVTRCVKHEIHKGVVQWQDTGLQNRRLRFKSARPCHVHLSSKGQDARLPSGECGFEIRKMLQIWSRRLTGQVTALSRLQYQFKSGRDHHIPDWCNSSTAGSDPADFGANPESGAIIQLRSAVGQHACLSRRRTRVRVPSELPLVPSHNLVRAQASQTCNVKIKFHRDHPHVPAWWNWDTHPV